MNVLRVLESAPELGGPRVVERHDVTHRRPEERHRLRGVLEVAYPDRTRFTIEELDR